jgi:hypothetical protein
VCYRAVGWMMGRRSRLIVLQSRRGGVELGVRWPQQGSGSITRICTAGSCRWNMANRGPGPFQASAELRDGL